MYINYDFLWQFVLFVDVWLIIWMCIMAALKEQQRIFENRLRNPLYERERERLPFIKELFYGKYGSTWYPFNFGGFLFIVFHCVVIFFISLNLIFY